MLAGSPPKGQFTRKVPSEQAGFRSSKRSTKHFSHPPTPPLCLSPQNHNNSRSNHHDIVVDNEHGQSSGGYPTPNRSPAVTRSSKPFSLPPRPVPPSHNSSSTWNTQDILAEVEADQGNDTTSIIENRHGGHRTSNRSSRPYSTPPRQQVHVHPQNIVGHSSNGSLNFAGHNSNSSWDYRDIVVEAEADQDNVQSNVGYRSPHRSSNRTSAVDQSPKPHSTRPRSPMNVPPQNIAGHNSSSNYPDITVEEEADIAVTSVPASKSYPSLTIKKSDRIREEQMQELKGIGFPSGLAMQFGKTRALYPLRFWILDNSGSMMSSDGKSIRGDKSYQCTRWAELQESVLYHVNLASILQATTIFRFLNDPGALAGPQEFSVADHYTHEQQLRSSASHAKDEIVSSVRQMLRKCSPMGATPLTEHLVAIQTQIAAVESKMRRTGLCAVVVIATDGLPTNREGESSAHTHAEFMNTLKRLQSLPVWVVIRLCTDDKEVVRFYNELDKTLELPLEVLDDFFGEAKETYKVNNWLNYCYPLHRCREMGYHHRILDLLDERALNKEEILEFAILLYGSEPFQKIIDINEDWNKFIKIISDVQKHEKPQWNPATKKMGKWIDVNQLKKFFRIRSSLFGKLTG